MCGCEAMGFVINCNKYCFFFRSCPLPPPPPPIPLLCCFRGLLSQHRLGQKQQWKHLQQYSHDGWMGGLFLVVLVVAAKASLNASSRFWVLYGMNNKHNSKHKLRGLQYSCTLPCIRGRAGVDGCAARRLDRYHCLFSRLQQQHSIDSIIVHAALFIRSPWWKPYAHGCRKAYMMVSSDKRL